MSKSLDARPRILCARGFAVSFGSVKLSAVASGCSLKKLLTNMGERMTDQGNDPELSEEMHSLLDSSKSTSEAFTIIGTELIEMKAMLMTLIDLQKSALFASGVSEQELESNVQNLLDGYRNRFLNALAGRIKQAAAD